MPSLPPSLALLPLLSVDPSSSPSWACMFSKLLWQCVFPVLLELGFSSNRAPSPFLLASVAFFSVLNMNSLQGVDQFSQPASFGNLTNRWGFSTHLGAGTFSVYSADSHPPWLTLPSPLHRQHRCLALSHSFWNYGNASSLVFLPLIFPSFNSLPSKVTFLNQIANIVVNHVIPLFKFSLI